MLNYIGNTPLVKLRSFPGNILVKAEFLNPGGSIKDRVAKHVLLKSQEAGLIAPGRSTIVEATSGNTGIGVALVGGLLGYEVIIVMPEQMSDERKKLIRGLGAELIEYKCDAHFDLCLNKVQEILEEVPNSWEFGQFTNELNPEAHYLTTGPEIWEQTEGKIDIFVAGVGSGGTLTGVGKYLKEKNPRIQVIAVEPRSSAAILGREPGLHQIQGIGDGFIPPVLDMSLVDMVITVTDQDAVDTTRMMARKEGMLCGTSSGANVWAAMHLAVQDKTVVTIAPDRAERYFSTALL